MPRAYNWAEDTGLMNSWLKLPGEFYERPAWPDCLSCDGRGWYGTLDDDGGIIDVRCICWETEAILNGPGE